MRGLIPALVMLALVALTPRPAEAQLDLASPFQVRILENGKRTLARLERVSVTLIDQTAVNTDRTLDAIAARMGPPDPISNPSDTRTALLTRTANNAKLGLTTRRLRE